MHEKVIAFIDRFALHGTLKNTIVTFTQRCCYWFVFILHNRFSHSEIMYDPIENHFITKVENRLYDITGEVTDTYKTVNWDTYLDELEKKRIVRDFIEF